MQQGGRPLKRYEATGPDGTRFGTYTSRSGMNAAAKKATTARAKELGKQLGEPVTFGLRRTGTNVVQYYDGYLEHAARIGPYGNATQAVVRRRQE